MTRAPKPDPLHDLEERINAAKGEEAGPRHQDEHYSQAHLAWRMVIELVAGIAIGFGIGLGLDAIFGTRPIFLVLFILLGFAAGVRTMLHSAKEIQAQAVEAAATKTPPPEAEDEGR